jgi:hypothetical protein
MTISIVDGATTLPLHPDLYWTDENDWHPVQQTVERAISGALIISTAALLAGRPITLRSFDESSGWVPRSTVDTLRNWAATPGKQLTLTIRGVSRTVIFRHQDGTAMEAEPVVHYGDVEPQDFYRVTLRFMEV